LSRETRLNLIRQIEADRGSRLLVAVWGDRQNLQTIMAPDAPPVFFDHLEKIGKAVKLDVLLYTVGGHTLTAWGLANLIREYCDTLGVLIPHRALSAGTLFSLAADEIIMSRIGRWRPNARNSNHRGTLTRWSHVNLRSGLGTLIFGSRWVAVKPIIVPLSSRRAFPRCPASPPCRYAEAQWSRPRLPMGPLCLPTR
jgi:Serine dehydrogenase proteinase